MTYYAKRKVDGRLIKEEEDLERCMEGVQSFVNINRSPAEIYNESSLIMTVRSQRSDSKKKFDFVRVQVGVQVHHDDKQTILDMAAALNKLRQGGNGS